MNLSLLCFLLSFGLYFSASSFAMDCGILAKIDGRVPVTKFFIISERCSGSNYVKCLLLKMSLSCAVQKLKMHCRSSTGLRIK